MPATATSISRSSSPLREVRERFLGALFSAGVEMGGAISGEHGIGTAKQHAFLELEPPERIDLMRRIKAAFDPDAILNPDKIMGAGRAGPERGRRDAR